MDLDGRGGEEELGGKEGGETIIRIYCIRKKSIFNKRKPFKYKITTTTITEVTVSRT